MYIPRFLQFVGYETLDYQATVRDQKVYVKLEAKPDKKMNCHKCARPLGSEVSRHRLELKDLPLRGFETVLRLFSAQNYAGLRVSKQPIYEVSRSSRHLDDVRTQFNQESIT